MLGKFFSFLSSLFSSLFGGGSKSGTTTNTGSSAKPTNSGSSTSTGSGAPSGSGGGGSTASPSTPVNPPETAHTIPQDATELRPDSIVVMAHEMDEVVVIPGQPEVEFDPDPIPEDPAPTATPVPEPAPTPAPEPDRPTGRQPRYLWCLDNGHGSKQPGKRSPVYTDDSGKQVQFLEYEFNRDIVARIIKGLEAEGIQYYNVVPEVHVDDFLVERVERANRKISALPKIYLSIHANAGPTRPGTDWVADSTKGIETWFFHGSKRGQSIAAVFQKHLIAKTGFFNRHLKSQPDKQFYVLRKTNMTAVLTENGFYNNQREVKELMRNSVRQKIADAHIAAIIELEENGI